MSIPLQATRWQRKRNNRALVSKRYSLLCCFLLSAPATMAQQSAALLKSRLQTEPAAQRLDTYLEIAKVYEISQPDSAVNYCNEGIRLAEKLDDWHSEALLLLQLGKVNALLHHVELARSFYNEALAVFRSRHEEEGIAQAYDALGLLDGQVQNVPLAARDLDRSMKFYKDARDSTGISETYQGFGTVYEEQGDTEKALSYYLRALVQYEQRAQKPEAYYAIVERVGQLYLKRGNSRMALYYLQEGVQNSSKAADRDREITLMEEEGKIFEKTGKDATGLSYYKEALAVAKEFNRPEEQANALTDIAGILKKKNTAQSLEDLKTALHIAEKLHEPQLEATIYEALAGVYQQQKDYKEALKALEEHQRLLDSLLKVDTIHDIAALDSSYVLEMSREKIGELRLVNRKEKKELDISLVILIAVIVILVLLGFYLWKVRRLNQRLRVSNQVRDKLFSVIGHDLKGPAGNMVQLLTLLEMKTFPAAELKTMIAGLRKQATASSDLLNALFEWGKAQLRGVQVQPEIFATQPVIGQNINLLSQQAYKKNIAIHDYVPMETCIFSDPNHFDFIIRNLLSNAIKFTQEGGQIDINGRRSEDRKMMIFSVKDSGVGISPERQKEFLRKTLSVSFGTKGEKGHGLGLLLVKEFVQAGGGRIWLESKEGEGTTFYFSFPCAEEKATAAA